MGTALTVRRYTVADLEQFPDDGNRYELLNGMLIVTPSPRLRYQAIASQIGAYFVPQLVRHTVNLKRVVAIIAGSVVSLLALYAITWGMAYVAYPGAASLRIGSDFEKLVGASAVLTWASRAVVVATCVLAGYVACRLDHARAAWVGAVATGPYAWAGLQHLLRPPMPYYPWYWFLLLAVIPLMGLLGALIAQRQVTDTQITSRRQTVLD